MLRPRAQVAVENVGSFQYLINKDIRKKQIWTWKNPGPQFFDTRGPDGPLNFWLILTPEYTFETHLSGQYYRNKISLTILAF